jgi:predicted metalloprotease with PDZ domain
MLRYTLYQKNPASHYIYVDLEIDGVSGDTLELQLPAWRPGRYELGNFARNIKRLEAWDDRGSLLHSRKLTKDLWEIRTGGNSRIKVTYSYYAAELNAGSCYADTTQLYVNPVHLCFYVPSRMNETHEVHLKVPDNYRVACALPAKGRTLTASSFDQLADSPFICSPTLVSERYEVDGVNFHLHFQGEQDADMEKIRKDFVAFTKTQLDFWEGIPVKDYHFLFQVTPLKFYHGVEHAESTVIALGPGHSLTTGGTYEDLLGVSSHELFHTWNVKAIRPAEMLPYDFSRENYARTGFVYEGFTTYYGDKLLLSSGVFSLQQYFQTLEERITKHLHNYGRFNLGVGDSSWDTWLDGYVPGAPYRKTSIYDEGCLVALLLDMAILRSTVNKRSLRDVCRELYRQFGKAGRGYTEKDILDLVSSAAGTDMTSFFDQHVYAPSDLAKPVEQALAYIGIELGKKDSTFVSERLYGFRIMEGTNKISLVAPYSPAWKAGIFAGDEVVAINGVAVRNSVNQWLAHFSKSEGCEVAFISNEQLRTTSLEKDKKGNSWFYTPLLLQKQQLSLSEQEAFAAWKQS